MTDPNGTNFPNQNAGGNSKITKTSKEGASYEGMQGYGFMVNAENLMTPKPANGTTLPIAKPMEIMTYGDPNNTTIDHKDGFGLPRE